MKTLMKQAAEERLEMLRDTYPPGSKNLSDMLLCDDPPVKVPVQSRRNSGALKVPTLDPQYSSEGGSSLNSNTNEPSSSMSAYPQCPSISLSLIEEEDSAGDNSDEKLL